MQRLSIPCLILGLTVLLAGCASTQKRYEKAVDLEAQGRYAEAADYYIKVMQREPAWEDARSRLRDVGQRAIEGYWAEAEAAAAVGNYEQALAVLDGLNALREQAAGVGVLLAAPDDYARYYEELTAGAVASLIARGEQAEQAHHWAEAIRAYERAQQRYRILPGQSAELDRARVRVYLKWSEQEMLREHYRAAYDRAQRALGILGPAAPGAGQALQLQEDALAAGTHTVAFLPLWSTEQVAREAPRHLLQHLNDVLLYEHWNAPPLFLHQADPVALHREQRRLRYDRTRVARGEAAEIGRVVGADFVVLGEVTGFHQSETDLREKRRAVRTRGRNALDTTFVEQQYTLELRAEVTFYVVDPYSRRIIDQGSVREAVSGRLARGVYEGDPRDLDLSMAYRRLFDAEEQHAALLELEDRLIDELAARFAIRVYDTLLNRIA